MKISVRVTPNSKSESVEILENGSYRIKVREKPIDGKVNEKVRELLAKEFKARVRDVRIITKIGRKKVVEIVA